MSIQLNNLETDLDLLYLHLHLKIHLKIKERKKTEGEFSNYPSKNKMKIMKIIR